MHCSKNTSLFATSSRRLIIELSHLIRYSNFIISNLASYGGARIDS